MIYRLKRSTLRLTPRIVFMSAALVARDIQVSFGIPIWTMVLIAIPALVALTIMTDWMIDRLREWFDLADV